jgi:anti-sigma factor RsiW
MTHCPTDDVLLDYAAGRLNQEQAAAFERHAKTCARCDGLRTAQEAVWQNLDEWSAEPVSTGFNRELWRRIDADAGESWTKRVRKALQPGFWRSVAPLAVALALVATAFVLDHSGKPTGQPKPYIETLPAVTVSVNEADQLERTLDDVQLLREINSASAAERPESELM